MQIFELGNSDFFEIRRYRYFDISRGKERKMPKCYFGATDETYVRIKFGRNGQSERIISRGNGGN